MGNMRFKVGDRVRIKSLDWYNRYTNGTEVDCGAYPFTSDMKEFCGQERIIANVCQECYVLLGIDDRVVWTDEMIEGLVEEETKPKDIGEVSDGYHTFNELYEYRLLYNAALFNEFAKQGLYDVHKSRKHSDGEHPFGDSNWFIVMAELPTGQISNHYEMKDWNKFQIPEKPLANKWDEHSPRDVADRLIRFTTPKKKYPKTYEECLVVTSYDKEERILYLLEKFKQLLICRDAYWKVAGEEMGLGRPWEPDWTDLDQLKYCIWVDVGEFVTMTNVRGQHVLAFPTEEIRDAFKENFDPDIEICKEFL